MRFRFRSRGLLSAALLSVAAACHDASTRPLRQSPLVGTWELTTHFDTFSFETGGPIAPDCPWTPGTSPYPYCTHYRTTTAGAYLAGLVEVTDSSSTADTVSKTVYAVGTLQVSFCDSIDYQGLTGCLHVSDRSIVQYKGLIAGPPDSTTTASLQISIDEPEDGFGLQRKMRTYSGLSLETYAGDSIYGPIYWGGGGRSPPSYRGSFVMRRVK
jgi:hypothetical protein